VASSSRIIGASFRMARAMEIVRLTVFVHIPFRLRCHRQALELESD
jgi:hypothetical protein